MILTLKFLAVLLVLMAALQVGAVGDGYTLPPLTVISADNAADLREIGRIGRGVWLGAALSPAGDLRLDVSVLGVRVQRTDDQALVAGILPPQGAASAVFIPNSSYIAIGTSDGSILIWDIMPAEDTPAHILTGFIYPVRYLSASADGAWLAAGDPSGVIRMWDTRTWRERGLFTVPGWLIPLLFADERPPMASGYYAAAMNVRFSPDARWIIGDYEDGTTRLFNADDGALVRVIGGQGGRASSVVFSADGAWMAQAGSQGVLVIYDSETLTPRNHLYGHIRGTTSAAFNADGTLVAAGGLDNGISLWDISHAGDFEPLVTLRGHVRGVTGVAFSPDGTLLASSSYDGTLRLWGVALTQSQPQQR